MAQDTLQTLHEMTGLSDAFVTYSHPSQHVSTLCSEKKHPLTFSFIPPWKMPKFSQNFQGMFRRKRSCVLGDL